MAQNNTMVKKGRCINYQYCSKADHKEIIEVNVGEDFECPECEEGLIEIKTKPFPWIIVMSGVTLVAVIAGVFILYSNHINSSLSEPNEGGNTIVVDSVQRPDTVQINATPQEHKDSSVIKLDTLPTGKNEKASSPISAESNQIVTRDLGYAVWTGKIKKGKPHDVQGTLKFKTSHVIDSRDDKGRIANPGDKVIGTFEDGHLTQGKWYKSDGNVESIILGGL